MTPSAEHLAYHAAVLEKQANYRDLGRRFEKLGSWKAVLEDIRKGGRGPEPELSWQTLERSGSRLVLRTDHDFPPLLREIPWPPHAIYVRGKLPEVERSLIAVVGTRKATPEGKETARTFAQTLAEAGVGIASGLALGIDGAAHEGALAAGGYTAAVLATGPDIIYPRYHEKLGRRILEQGGALISEYPPGSPAMPYRFLERNRLVSGLAQGTLIIEAPLRSGSRATARFAVEQDRAVFVLPGPARHPNFAGSHELIRQGAELVTEPDHILTALGLKNEPGLAEDRLDSEEESAIMTALRAAAGPLDIDKIVERAHLEARVVNQALSFLIIKGLVEETDGGYAAR
ncbi:MAG TPA: DNA-processing protein DprA [Candidatus Paceibacterota bacterium]|nr:DNA-processing protein DprA [Candidatus Paceibacterota bacterium]